MYNTRSGNNRGNQYNRKIDSFRQQQPELQQQEAVMHCVTTSITPKTAEPQNQTALTPPVTQYLQVKPASVLQKTMVEGLEQVEGEEKKAEVKWPPKRKINKKEQKKRLNARIRRLVCPKSPLMVFSELYKDVTIKLDEQLKDNSSLIYTASFEVDGQLYTGQHVSKTQAKHKACENFLRKMLAKRMSDKNEEMKAEVNSEGSENGTSVKPRGAPQEDFPWPHFASLAMHTLITHWELQPITRHNNEEASVNSSPKIVGMKKFPENPQNYNPVQLLNQMVPGTKFTEQTLSANQPSLFEASCELKNLKFTGQGSTKKSAKRECAISTIKHFWNFDYHSVGTK